MWLWERVALREEMVQGQWQESEARTEDLTGPEEPVQASYS